jgi:hypothetical protein
VKGHASARSFWFGFAFFASFALNFAFFNAKDAKFAKENGGDMKKLILFVVTIFATAALVGCGVPAANTNAVNTNANVSGGPVGPPNVEGLKALETKAFDAYKNKDGKFFEGFLTDKFAMSQNGQRLDKAATVKWIA